MRIGFAGFFLRTLVLLGVAGSAAAHHMSRFDRCKLYTVEGDVLSIDWGNPHVKLSIKSGGGMTYELVWLSLRQLNLAGIQKDALKVGDHVVAKGSKQSEDAARASMLLTAIRKPTDGLEWSQPPQGC